MKASSLRFWFSVLLLGLVGQFAWIIENIYFNVYLYNEISTDLGCIAACVYTQVADVENEVKAPADKIQKRNAEVIASGKRK